ncbi:fumarylacetoacetate hydrolase family protein [Frankia sp. CNm7]|uniref:Fumarylacetoacetate hydrolase family protein n=1 Tax=Frankia nepalensis TaxID=1836974 RepID=A0A937UR67_9ACTN|nr:fumarylacetoacetate hydrolase family protein [Frankia nepalensis]MBL7497553.1 fumarylacetoacetate hydrolase family protein [Frankia nepalensis]MBL7509634.1 fumarylacetoacetate hydrolase family protein [Frankia nepalensis]MBL7517120.1 fumarylacetoacetate hydrolase family protein [Frankia nepalensis]MBL7631007.1 fumarylacetoacetate hydrolase family protein [Frankia nepalensis]
MRWCRFRGLAAPGGRPDAARFGVVEDDETVRPVDGDLFGEFRPRDEWLSLTDVELLPPVVPNTFFAVGLNYTAHIHHAQARGMTAAKVPERPEVGYRANSALVGHGAAVVKPADCAGRFEAEAELVAVIGRPARRCTREQARRAVFGWTIGNDVSARDWQHTDRTLWRAKNSDTFKPMGPWIETDVDPMGSRTLVAVGGDTVAEFATGAMVFDPYDYIVEISRYITLSPGDVLWMGTDAVVEMPVGKALGVTITGIGTLSNPVVQEM